MALQDLNMMLPSRLGCPLSLKTPNMGNIGSTLSGGAAAHRLRHRNLSD